MVAAAAHLQETNQQLQRALAAAAGTAAEWQVRAEVEGGKHPRQGVAEAEGGEHPRQAVADRIKGAQLLLLLV